LPNGSLRDFVQAARDAAKARDFTRSLALWSEVRERSRPELGTHYHLAVIGMTDALALLGRADEARAIAQSAADHPSTAALGAKVCMRLAQNGNDWQDMERHARSLMTLSPDEPHGYAGLARALLVQERLDEAEGAASAAMQRFPTFSDPYVTHARVAMARMDWENAVRRWGAIEAAFPDHPTAARLKRQCLEKLQFLGADEALSTIAAATPLPTPAASGEWQLKRDDPAALSGFLMRFESLGPNCEFGFLQKGFGAEPLGLLRWAGTSTNALIQALKNRFAGVGDPAQTTLTTKNRLYFAVDERFGLRIHTGIREGEMPPQTVLEKQCRRMAFLRDRLLADLASQDKIFVFAPYDIEDDALERISALMSHYGPNSLLCIKLADAAHPAGAIEHPSDCITVGYAARKGWVWEDGHQRWIIDQDQWLSFLEAAWRHRARGLRRKEELLF
jgi:tetratricopeptide (TPR) repeat protein